MKASDVCENCAGPLASRHERRAHLCHHCQLAGAWDGEAYKRELARLHEALETRWGTQAPDGRQGRNG